MRRLRAAGLDVVLLALLGSSAMVILMVCLLGLLGLSKTWDGVCLASFCFSAADLHRRWPEKPGLIRSRQSIGKIQAEPTLHFGRIDVFQPQNREPSRRGALRGVEQKPTRFNAQVSPLEVSYRECRWRAPWAFAISGFWGCWSAKVNDSNTKAKRRILRYMLWPEVVCDLRSSSERLNCLIAARSATARFEAQTNPRNWPRDRMSEITHCLVCFDVRRSERDSALCQETGWGWGADFICKEKPPDHRLPSGVVSAMAWPTPAPPPASNWVAH